MALSSSTTASTAPGATGDWNAGPGAVENGTGRALGRRPGLPGGRALVGAALVVVAAVMVYAAYLGASTPPTRTYAVAARDLRVNDRIGPGDVAVVNGDLPPEVTGQAFDSADELLGAVVLAPLDRNALVVRSAVVSADRPGPAADAYEVSFTAPAWKLGGARLQEGELIDLVPTGDSRDASRPPASPVRDVRVVALADNSAGSLGTGTGDMIVTVAAADPSAYVAIVGAVHGEFWVVRSTRGPRSAPGAGPSAPAPAPGLTWGPPPTTSTAATATTATAPGTTGRRP